MRAGRIGERAGAFWPNHEGGLGANDGGRAGDDEAHGHEEHRNATVEEAFESCEFDERHDGNPYFHQGPRRGMSDLDNA